MILLSISCLIVALILAAVVFVSRKPWAQCLLWGHEPKLTIEDHGVFKEFCVNCKRPVKS